MLKLLKISRLGLFLTILAQFTFEMCVPG